MKNRVLIALILSIVIGPTVLIMKIRTMDKQLQESAQVVEKLGKEKVEVQKRLEQADAKVKQLEEEIAKWREAAQPISDLFRNELFYVEVSDEDLLYNLKPENLWLALRPCKWITRDDVCKQYVADSDIPVYVVVLETKLELD
jgi:hypothetical protein